MEHIACEGIVTVKAGSPVADILDRLAEVFEDTDIDCDCGCDWRDSGQPVRLSVVSSYDTDDDAARDCLSEITGYVSSGYVNCIDDNNSVWRFFFRNGKWEEDSGRPCFLSDEKIALLMQLVEREKAALLAKCVEKETTDGPVSDGASYADLLHELSLDLKELAETEV